MLKEGQEAPDFALTDPHGRVVKLSDFRSKWVVVYFYPKDFTPGCTREACGFRDYYEYYQDKNIVVLGVSVDREDSHKKFADKYALPFTLLSDPEGRVCTLYGVYGKKKLYGREFWGIKRTTFLIDGKGKITKIFDNVNVETHHRDVLHFVEGIKDR